MNIRWWLILSGAFLVVISLGQRSTGFLNKFLSTIGRLVWALISDLRAGLPMIKALLEVLTGLAMLALLTLLVMACFLLFRSIHPWQQSRETIVQFVDLRLNETRHGDDRDGKTMSRSSYNENDRAITELFAAKLRAILSTHDLAYHYCRVHFRNQEIYSSRTCADMTSIWSQVEIKSLFFEEPTRMAIGSSPFNEDLGQISTQAGPITASFPLRGILQFLQLRKADNILITGSLQDQGNGPHLVSQLSYGKKSWAWDISRKDLEVYSSVSQPELSLLIEELAYHVTNRIMGQTSQLIDALPGSHFEKYSKLLKEFVTYIQNDSPLSNHQPVSTNPSGSSHTDAQNAEQAKDQAFSRLVELLREFLKSERTDLRSYYMLYIIGIIAITRGEFKVARELLAQANAIEPSVVASILQTGVSPRKLKWKKQVFLHLSKDHRPKSFVPKVDQLRAAELAKGLANVNAALGFSYEQAIQADLEKPDLNSRLMLEDAASAYHRAFEYKSDDPLYLSNQAEVKQKIADLLYPKDSFLDQRLRYRTEAHHLLRQACRMTASKNIKYAWLRKGNHRLGKGDLQQAVMCFQKAWDADPSFLVAARNLANTYSMRGEYDKAISICHKALQQVGSNRLHFLNTQQIHGWIHNCRGWAYLRKVRDQRLQGMNHRLKSECLSWLNIAESNFGESLTLLPEHQSAIPRMNKLYVWFENCLLVKSDRPTNFIACLKSLLADLPADNLFSQFYQSIAGEHRESFRVLFECHWKNHTFVPSEYIGLIEDLLMLDEYLDLGFNPCFDNHLEHKAIMAAIAVAINSLNEYLPSCFLGINYLWYGRPKNSHDCWHQRREKMNGLQSQETEEQREERQQLEEPSVTSSDLNYNLWHYLYGGLCDILSNSYLRDSSDKSFRFVFDQAMKLEPESPTRQYALDLLEEAKDFGEILAVRSPFVLNKRQRLLFNQLFRSVNITYYAALKTEILRRAFDAPARLWRRFLVPWNGLFRALSEFVQILLAR